MLDRVYGHDDVVEVTVDGETVVYRAADESLHKLDGPATAVWLLLDGAAGLRTTVDDLAAVYGAPRPEVERDVLELVRALVERGLARAV